MKTQAIPKTATGKKGAESSKKSPSQKPSKDAAIAENTSPVSKKSLVEKNLKSVPTDGEMAATSPQVPTEEIASRAYKIWQQQGCPHGCEEEHWRQAEREILR